MIFFLLHFLQTESKSSTLFTADAETSLVWMRFFAGIFHISFSPLTSLFILILNFTEWMAADVCTGKCSLNA